MSTGKGDGVPRVGNTPIDYWKAICSTPEFIAQTGFPQVFDLKRLRALIASGKRGLLSVSATAQPELWVLTRVIDDSDRHWDLRFTISGSPERIQSLVDLSLGIPPGWQLLQGQAAREFLETAGRDEAEYQHQKKNRSKN
jgi:hypothetical protein